MRIQEMLSPITRRMIYDVCTRIVVTWLVVYDVIAVGGWLFEPGSGSIDDILFLLNMATALVLPPATIALAIGLILLALRASSRRCLIFFLVAIAHFGVFILFLGSGTSCMPRMDHGFAAILWLIASVLLIPVLVSKAVMASRNAYVSGLCRRCRYDIRYCAGDACPECGEPFVPMSV